MSIRTALLLGIFLVAAALVHGGLYTAGHDFVVNRFTGWHEFVPAEDGEEDAAMPIREHGGATVALTSPDLDARVPAPARRAERRGLPVGR